MFSKLYKYYCLLFIFFKKDQQETAKEIAKMAINISIFIPTVYTIR